MNSPKSRRQFLADVGREMLVASVGYNAANDLGHHASCIEATSAVVFCGENEDFIADADVLAAARREERTLVTENVRDFRLLENALLAAGSHHAGLVYTSNRQFPRGDPGTTGRLVRALDPLLRTTPDLRDRAVFLPSVDR